MSNEQASEWTNNEKEEEETRKKWNETKSEERKRTFLVVFPSVCVLNKMASRAKNASLANICSNPIEPNSK